jgi:hypothetical protein
MRIRHEVGGRARGFRRRCETVVRAAWLVALPLVLGLGRVEGQWRSQLGTITSAGRVTYFVAHAGLPAHWSLSLSAGRGLQDGDWESVALDAARQVWLSEGGRVGLHAIARYDRIKAPRSGTMAAEAVWRATSRLTLSGTYAVSLAHVPAGGPNVRFQGVGTGVKVKLVAGFAMTAVVRYEAARGSFRTDLGLRGVR